MQKLKTFIVENENAPLNSLIRLLSGYPKVIDLESITIARSFNEAQNIILNGNKFNLSIIDKFLDSDKTCFNLINKSNRGSFGIIALNTQDSESHKYFEELSNTGGFFVLRKPFNDADIKNFIEQIKSFKPNTIENKESNKPLLLKEKEKYYSIEQEKIVYIEVNNNYCDIYFQSIDNIKKSFPIKNQLTHYHEILNPNLFHRISEKHIINMNLVEKYEDGSIKLKGKYMNEYIWLPLPGKNKQDFLDKFIK